MHNYICLNRNVKYRHRGVAQLTSHLPPRKPSESDNLSVGSPFSAAMMNIDVGEGWGATFYVVVSCFVFVFCVGACMCVCVCVCVV